ncbi:type III PLP-dependent enzyme [Streptomyces monticola]|uniref:Type III PLP-dependent enzyme n=1 Tax=Streptomyces monticola TaxID=2666263 RepID=A0ABW2JTN0_9ACTN
MSEPSNALPRTGAVPPTHTVPPAHTVPPTPAVPPALPVAPEVLSSVPTPAYVYDVAEVRRNHAALSDALPAGAGLYYSLKANAHPAVLKVLRERGALPEVCSTGELDAALGAGWPAADVLYSGPGKRDEEIDDALRRGVRLFSVDSAYAIEQLDRRAGGLGATARCLLRINDDQPVPGQGLAMTGVASQFGADTRWVLDEPERFASRAHAEVMGLHLYMGTNLGDVDALVGQFARSLRTARTLAAALAGHGVRIRVLDLGGGFGAPFATAGERIDLSGLRPKLTALLDEELVALARELTPAAASPSGRPGDDVPQVVFESGRYLVGTAGVLLSAVLDVKRSHGKDVVVLESGINHLGGMSGLRRLPALNPHLVAGSGPDGSGPDGSGPDASDRQVELNALVAGPLCTPLDTWARSARLPALRPGDLVAVPNVGAYGLSASLVAFLGHPLPAEAVIDGDRPGAAPDVTRLAFERRPAGHLPAPAPEPRPRSRPHHDRTTGPAPVPATAPAPAATLGVK